MKGENIMKKIIGIIIASIVFANIAFAEIRLIEEKTLKGKKASNYYMATVCVDGYKFVITGLKASERSMVQFYEAGNNQSPKPAKC